MPRGPPVRCDSGIVIPRWSDIFCAQDVDTRGETNDSHLIGRARTIETSFQNESERCGFQVSTGQRGMSKGMGPNITGLRMM